MKIETMKLSNNKLLYFCKTGKAKGIKELLKCGYSQCDNKSFFRMGDVYAHYNSVMKGWVFENW